MVRPISAGKEAEVLLCLYNGSPLAVKAYRLYRTPHRGCGPSKVDALSRRAAHEFDLLRMAWRAGVAVPTPAHRVEDMFSMRYIGDDKGPAPRLKDVELDEPEAFLAQVVASVEALARAGVVHGDLSAYNILVHGGRPWVIDLSEGILVYRTGVAPWRRLSQAQGALSHGLSALALYFARYGHALPEEELVARIVNHLDRFGVLKV